MPEATKNIGNTQIAPEEFQRIIEGKTNDQLRDKIKLGAFLQTNLAEKEVEDPRTEVAIASLQEQIEILQKELTRRQEELIRIRQDQAEKKLPEGPLDQVIGVQSLNLSGKSDMG